MYAARAKNNAPKAPQHAPWGSYVNNLVPPGTKPSQVGVANIFQLICQYLGQWNVSKTPHHAKSSVPNRVLSRPPLNISRIEVKYQRWTVLVCGTDRAGAHFCSIESVAVRIRCCSCQLSRIRQPWECFCSSLFPSCPQVSTAFWPNLDRLWCLPRASVPPLGQTSESGTVGILCHKKTSKG
jgi:hypothetical protein